MIIGIGTDIIKVKRVKIIYARYGQRMLQRICTNQEIEEIDHRSLSHFIAKRFAAKEAYAKALGYGIGKMIGWQDIEILNKNGKPYFSENTKFIQDKYAHLTIADEDEFALAFVVIEKKT
ncbi:holo-ACP synthase [Lyticum sinuosum]|uniref:Holo-[acyl-carrier-protein] synthase n=1 Tax=Lyticum sinuosum TaxID=1332059 RepID=A0AAE4VK52_9RICK|nr:holo-ACP synthase [Lyticum sinuosum]MDZ5761436.1 Holo-[acyl-carrier-protein] synthase [Lyticum sinuosum]